jgi:hypothetical protein
MEPPVPKPGFEIVHFVFGYYDGVLEGIADCGGAPHHFALEEQGAEDQVTDRYRLTPLSPEVFQAAVEGLGDLVSMGTGASCRTGGISERPQSGIACGSAAQARNRTHRCRLARVCQVEIIPQGR